MRCPRKRKERCFSIQPASPLCAPAGASQVPLPGLPCLCCPALPSFLESEIFGPQVFPTSTSVHTCPVDPLMRRLASPTREGSVRNVSSSGAPGVSCSGVCFSCGDSSPRSLSFLTAYNPWQRQVPTRA